ncbi:hypothetical protein K7J14_13780 [Treponema zuelzerae]|uniref:Uncharacterized protein n=1 Tax=Teretinema zuelzerae TaxID=156 RepID=A0AAE3EJR9_9SPIR|nr:hypothetical protein [Teretinema zuelzerae]MCD1655762.1 hypothetical protein [Teretinema zuelzerae]
MRILNVSRFLPLTVLFSLVSCFNPVLDGKTESVQAGNDGKTVAVKIDFASAETSGRSIRPVMLAKDISSVEVKLTVALNTMESYTRYGTPLSEFVFDEIAPDIAYIISVTCMDYEGRQHGPYAVTLDLTTGVNTVPVTVTPTRTVGGTGSFEIAAYNLPFDPSLTEWSITLTSIDTGTAVEIPTPSAMTDPSGNPYVSLYNTSLASGDYRLEARYLDSVSGSYRPFIPDTIVKIYDDRITKGLFGLAGGSGTAVYMPNETATSIGGKRLFVKVLSRDSYLAWQSGQSGPDIASLVPDAVGVATLDAMGAGSVSLIVPGTGAPYATQKNTPYFVAALIDKDDSLSSIVDVSSVSDYSVIKASYGDYSFESAYMFGYMRLVSSNDTGVLNLSDEYLAPNLTVYYYVGAAAKGDGSGSDIANLCTLDSALASAALSTETSGMVMIYLTESVTTSASYALSANATILSMLTNYAEDSRAVITYTGTTSPFLTVAQDPVTYNYPSLMMTNVILDGAGLSRTASLVSVSSGASFGLLSDSLIRNSTNTSGNGGAVYLSGGNMTVNGGSITGCTAANGGAVYAASGANLYLQMNPGDAISGNTATGEGGGVYLAAGSSLYGYSASLPYFASNTAATAGTENFALYGSWISSYEAYVASTRIGDGSSEDYPCSLEDALNAVNVYTIYLVEDIPVSSPLTVARTVSINSLNPLTPRTIYPNGTLTGSLITVSGNGYLNLSDVFIGSAVQTSSAYPLVSVMFNGTVSLNTGAFVRNNSNTAGNGGGLLVKGGTAMLSGGGIKGCSAPNGNGGAVYLEYDSASFSSSTLNLLSGNIGSSTTGDDNSALNGGGVYVTAQNSMSISGAASIAGNTVSAYGGGVFVETGGTLSVLTSDSYSITENTAGLEGGGAYFEDAGSLTDSYGSFNASCTGNTAEGQFPNIWMPN